MLALLACCRVVAELNYILSGTQYCIFRYSCCYSVLLLWLYLSHQLFVKEDEDTDLSDNFIVKTCQKFIPVTCNVPIYILLLLETLH